MSKRKGKRPPKNGNGSDSGSGEGTPPDQPPLFDPRGCDPMDLIEHLGDDVPPEHQWPQLLAKLFTLFETYNRRKGMPEKAAALDARDRVILLGDYFGGRLVYLPKGDSLRTAVLHALIWRDFTGKNIDQIVDRYDLNEVTVYEILRGQRRLARSRMQGKLFE